MSNRPTCARARSAAPRPSHRINHSALTLGVALALAAGTLQAQEVFQRDRGLRADFFHVRR